MTPHCGPHALRAAYCDELAACSSAATTQLAHLGDVLVGDLDVWHIHDVVAALVAN